jgi:hypothetical protein
MTKRPSSRVWLITGAGRAEGVQAPVVSIPSSHGRHHACIRDLFPGHKLAAGEASGERR